MHVANIRPTKKWTKLEDLITSAIGETATLKEDGLYKLQNNGGGDAYIISQENEPTDKSGMGFRLFPAHCYTYKKAPTCVLSAVTMRAIFTWRRLNNG